MLENRSVKAHFKEYPKRVWDTTFLLKGLQCDCDPSCYFLEKLFIQDKVVRGKLSSKSVSEEQRAKGPKEPIHHEPIYIYSFSTSYI